MTRRVNYADNIFYLKLVLKQVAAGLKLAVDADLARDLRTLLEEALGRTPAVAVEAEAIRRGATTWWSSL